MRALVQRVSRAEVRVDGRATGAIGRGFLVLLAVRAGDTEAEAEWLASKVASMRIFEGASGHFDRGLADVGGSVLVVSQFTLYGDARKGRRPDFTAAARPEVAERLYEHFATALGRLGVSVETGVFGAIMEVELVNDGPVSLVIDRDPADIGM